ncbi:MAG: hypothetical protein ACRC2T_02980 [Thermoguttaceae bacterium]
MSIITNKFSIGTAVTFVVLFVSLMCSGCGGGRPPVAKVEGTVTYKGAPIPNGSITFEVEGGRAGTGKIVDGNIVDVSTFEPNDGAPVGKVNIAIQAREKVEEVIVASNNPGETNISENYMGMGGKSLIPPHYNKPSTSKLTHTIEKGKVNTVNLNLD